ncbi:TonB-dependent receptor [Pedobacter foliorum]|uniref:SusC/RagA family TonB-linked outer membrane protein n=1 Tax=Pedobacter foliorum TaxID=2739058 RepID=UPI0015637BB4|nr:TonB-dependent receptor [Pedobacter foliorum]NRF41596.1 TonB-dependent receptor [Pedobacter foliorum]
MKRIFTKLSVLTFLCFFFINAASAQDITIHGVVSDGADKTTLPGVSVLVKGTKIGTLTDASGKYAVSAPANATLVFSYIGYDPIEVQVNNRTTINIELASNSQELEQVVVVGYGTQKKKDLTGSVAQVKGEDIARQPVLSATQAIQGKVAGVQIVSSGAPNSLPTVRVRGTGTMLAGANPLYVVDGVINEDIRNINSNDILTMDILKDASATAIYGMRAANGVILITTKKGKAGDMQIEYNATAGFKEAAKLVNMAGANQYAGYLNEANLYYGTGDVLITPTMLQNGANTDWYDAILKRGFQQNHNLSISGGSDKGTYLFSAGYLSDAGIIKTNDFNRLTLRSNNEYNITNWLKFTSMTSFSRSDVRNVNLDAFNIAYRAAPYVASKVDGKYGNTSLSNNISNPLLNLEKENNRELGNRIQSNFALDLKPISWLSFRSSFGIDGDFGKVTTYNYRYLNTGPNNVFLTEGGNQVRPNSALALEDKTTTRWVWDNTVTANKTFGEHSFNLLVGTTAEGFKFRSFKGSRTDVPESPDQWYLGAGSPTNQTNDNTGDKATRNSYISRFNYSYANRYLLTATFRADGTSRFPSQNRWGYFPSVGLGWNVVNESFMANQRIFSALKLRASYGKVGNDLIPTSTYLPLATINKPYFFDGKEYLGISFDNLPDKNIKWETTTEYDLGLDFGFLENKLTGEFNYYNKKTENALVAIRIPAILGDTDSQYTTNAASFSNKGVELALNWASSVGKDWSYSINGNVSYNQNKITGLNGGQALFDANVGGTFVTKSDNNQPIGSFFLLQADGVFQNAAEIAASAQKDAKPGDLRYRDISGDGVINDEDRAFSGSYQPKLTFGLNGNVTYKAFDLNIGTYGTSGGKVYNGKKAERENSKDNLETNVAKNRWTPNNPSNKIPRANLDKLPASTYFLEKGDFFRINNLTLGYSLPKEMMSKYKIQKLRVFVTAQNLATITGYSGFTPEIISDKTLNAGVESKIYPTTRTFAFGVNVGF